MAKKKSKKSTQKRTILALVLMVLSVLTICTMFMPAFSSQLNTIIGSSNKAQTTGLDVLTACFNGSVSSDFSSGANTLISLKNSDDYAFITGVFCWTYFITIVASGAVLITAILSLVKIRLKYVSMILGALLVFVALIAFIFGFIVASKFGYSGYLASYKTSASVAVYFMLAAIITGITEIISANS